MFDRPDCRPLANTLLHDLVDHRNPRAVLGEVLTIFSLIHEDADTHFLRTAHADTVALFHGEYPGYKCCSTRYHDLQHTMEVFLCAARLLHGHTLAGRTLSVRDCTLTLIAALFHDAGLIQSDSDNEGTGAKYTRGHEERSGAFVHAYFDTTGQPRRDADYCASVILTTCLGITPDVIPFTSPEHMLAGRILGAADLLAQLSGREYLEKLLYLYGEFAEAGFAYESMFDLLSRTHGFYAMARARIEGPLGGVDASMLRHFRNRWGLDRDMYSESTKRNMNYLNEVLRVGPEAYLTKLNRGGIVRSLTPSA
ncbi:hypothetical protein GGQ74_002471 [Desulfobaculum xiamenense]|uniref:HD/PDEase domain-containing protein n=1 Tax=Desulfobaculum xiamenense TaxID=995050 RepID=A0A846QKT6_9BACT|nr:hypothetical protein [Desulfobaculum xiamenense]NJB68798.1 hypothetical protein [Desulfobaculum xiamenense]